MASRFVTPSLIAALCASVAAVAHAQSESAGAYPSRPVRMIVPFTPGSVTDILARSLIDRLGAGLGQPVIVDNRPGAGGTIGTGMVAKANPDGYTLAVVSAGFAVTPAIYDTLPYDPAKDLAGVIPLANLPSVLFVPSKLGVRTVQELIELAKAKPGTLNYCSAGVGSASFVSAEKFRAATGIDVVHVPLKGAPEMVTETLAGRTHFGFSGIVAVIPAIREGRLLPLAVSTAKRSPILPDVPTVAEAGVPGAHFDFWIGVLAPAATPRTIVNRVHDEIARTLRLPEMQQRLASLGAEPLLMTPDEFDAYIREQLSSLGALLRAAGVKAN